MRNFIVKAGAMVSVKRSLTVLVSLGVICVIARGIQYGRYPAANAQTSVPKKTSRAEDKTSSGFLDYHYRRVNAAQDFSGVEGAVHPFAHDKNKCDTCHEVFQTPRPEGSLIVFREDRYIALSGRCLKCHQYHVGDHPVRITATLPVPKDLPLSDKKEITCITCHNPHFQRFSNRPWYPRSYETKLTDFITMKKTYKTYFLRRNNEQKDLCLSCHKGVYQ